MILLLDAANTILHKPALYTRVMETLLEEGYQVSLDVLIRNHKILAETTIFPDRTNKTFYEGFNREWFYSLGIIPNRNLLERTFSACSYLPWEVFDDTNILTELPGQKAVLSNFNSGLNELIEKHFSGIFSNVIVSEQEGVRKPDITFFKRALEFLQVAPSDVVYVGDSVKLDLEPALSLGMNAWLIDRGNHFAACPRRICSFEELIPILNSK